MTAQGVFPNVCTAVIDREARVFQHVPPLRLKTGVRYFIHSGQCNRRCEADTLTGAYSYHIAFCLQSTVTWANSIPESSPIQGYHCAVMFELQSVATGGHLARL